VTYCELSSARTAGICTGALGRVGTSRTDIADGCGGRRGKTILVNRVEVGGLRMGEHSDREWLEKRMNEQERTDNPYRRRDGLEPRACPFCGGTEFAVRKVGENDRQAWLGAYVHCAGCPANVYGFPTIEAAVEAWNKRIDEEDCGCEPTGVAEATDAMFKAQKDGKTAFGKKTLIGEPCSCRGMTDAITRGLASVTTVRFEGKRSPAVGIVTHHEFSPFQWCPWCGNAAIEIKEVEDE